LSLGRLVVSCKSVWAPCGLFGCSFLGFRVFSVGFVGCCGLALGVSGVYFLCT
jgi:hypothetical protein